MIRKSARKIARTKTARVRPLAELTFVMDRVKLPGALVLANARPKTVDIKNGAALDPYCDLWRFNNPFKPQATYFRNLDGTTVSLVFTTVWPFYGEWKRIDIKPGGKVGPFRVRDDITGHQDCHYDILPARASAGPGLPQVTVDP